MESRLLTTTTYLRTAGRKVIASYHDAQLPEWRGNPFLEALPPIPDEEAIIDFLTDLSPCSDQDRSLPAGVRRHKLGNLNKFLQPSHYHLKLFHKVSSLLRSGYDARNPLKRGYFSDVDNRIEGLKSILSANNPDKIATSSLSIFGYSGVGKTAGLEKALSFYPQVIYHNNYHGQNLNRQQLVWLKLDCSHDGRVKGMCISFFQAVDSLLGTNYYKDYAGNGRASVDAMITAMARVASIIGLGLLAIDEIQLLYAVKSGARRRANGPASTDARIVDTLIDFLVQLDNEVGVPIIFVGTEDAKYVFESQFRQARRSASSGLILWDRMYEKADNDREDTTDWRRFVDALESLQYIRNPSPLGEHIREVLYDHCQGIPALAVAIFKSAQERAIATGQEKLTPNMIRSVFRDEFRWAKRTIDLFRSGHESFLPSWEQDYPNILSVQERSQTTQTDSLTERDNAGLPLSPAASNTPKKQVKGSPKKLTGHQDVSQSNGLLACLADGLNVYDALHEAGYLRSAEEYLAEVH